MKNTFYANQGILSPADWVFWLIYSYASLYIQMGENSLALLAEIKSILPLDFWLDIDRLETFLVN